MTEKLGPQFQRVYHASWEETPVHLQKALNRHMWTPDSNFHPDVIHAGSLQSTLDIMGERRPYTHAYDIDMSHPSVSPVVWGEENQILQEDNDIMERVRKGTIGELLSRPSTRLANTGKTLIERQVDLAKDFNDKMVGVQPGLWEETPANAKEAAETRTVLPYRNRREDIGSVSFIVPKHAISEGGPVRYAGVRTREQAVNDEIDRKVKKK
jgi:hypothetical protein